MSRGRGAARPRVIQYCAALSSLSALLLVLEGVAPLSAPAPSTSPPAGPSSVYWHPDTGPLLDLKNSVKNWDDFVAGRGARGWDWGSPCRPVLWSFVTCSSDDRVVELQMACEKPDCTVPAVGQLPATLANLTALHTLNLADNAFHGPMPPDFGASAAAFPGLLSLQLQGNDLNGTLPQFGAGSWVSLSALNLTGNDFKGSTLPPEWGGSSMPYVKYLDLANCSLGGELPPSWGSNTTFANLRALILRGNQLQGGLPASWAESAAFMSLDHLDVSGTPHLLVPWSADPSNSLAGSLDPWLVPGGFNALTRLSVANNNFSATLPPTLWVANGNGSGPPSLQRLQSFNASAAGLQGALPSWGAPDVLPPGQAPTLTELILGYNPGLAGTLPESWATAPALSQLLTLRLEGCSFTGTLPGSWLDRRLPLGAGLNRLVLRQNGLTGTLPAVWGLRPNASVDSIYSLQVSFNHLEGTIPATWGASNTTGFYALRYLDLRGNMLMGTLPPGLGKTLNLLPGNAFCGAIPANATICQRRAYCDPLQISYFCSCGDSLASLPDCPGSGTLSAAKAAAIFVPVAAVVAGGVAAVVVTLLVLNHRRQAPKSLSLSPKRSSQRSADIMLSAAALPSGAILQNRLTGMTSCSSTSSLEHTLSRQMSCFKLDWQIDPGEIEFCKHEDGSLWELGSGGYGHVYKAVRAGVIEVACKVMRLDLLDGTEREQQLDAFMREAATLKACRDQHILMFLGACLKGDMVMLVTALMETDLARALKKDASMSGGRRIAWEPLRRGGRALPRMGLARRIALDVARGLAFLHGRKIVHRDLKSANILLARDGGACIADVGMARMLTQNVLTSLHGTFGTFAWCAPEMLLGRECNEKSDLYSFGVVLWELSTAEVPNGRYLRPLKVPEECPQEIAALAEQCLSDNPADRPSALQCVHVLASPSPPHQST